MLWHVGRDGQTFGPYSLEQLKAGVDDGTLMPTDLLWHEGMTAWAPASELSEVWPPKPPPPLPATAPKATKDETAPNGGKSHNPFRKHWQGDYSLPFSYWVIGLLLTGALVFSVSHLDKVVPTGDLGARASGILIVGVIGSLLLISVWQLVGIWRSATKHTSRGGRRLWSVLAKIGVCVGALQIVGSGSVITWPILKEGLMLASGEDDTPKDRLRLLRDATEVELAGGMPYGSAERLTQLLDSAATVRVVHLNNAGGRIVEANKIAQLIAARGLATYTATNCVSACTIAFLAGKRRYLGSTASIGFHSSSIGGVDQQHIPEINNDMRTTLAKHGVPDWFINKAVSTPAAQIWYPTNQELIAAHVVDAVVDAGQFGWSGIANWNDQKEVEQQLLRVPVFSALKRHAAADYSRLFDMVNEGVKSGKPLNEVVAQMNRYVTERVVPQYIARAPDVALIRYWKSQLAEIEHLRARGGRDCVEFMFPNMRAPGFNPSKLLSQQLVEEDLNALTQLIQDTMTLPKPRQRKADADRDVALVVNSIQASSPNLVEALSEPEKFSSDPALLCSALSRFYGDILRLPSERAAMALRQLMMETSQGAPK